MFKPRLEFLEDRLTPSNMSASPPGFVEAHAQVTVMQQNLDEGTDFLPLVAVMRAADISTAVSATFAQVQASDIPERMKLLADEIAADPPDLVGLQEATKWTVNGVTRYDMLGSLLTDLAADGQHYGVVVKSLENLPLSLPDAAGNVISYQDYNVILARTDLPPGALRLTNPQEGQYAAHLSLALPGLPQPVPLTRSWASVDVERWGERFRFVTTHLDPLSPAVNEAQAAELCAGPANTSLRVILAADLNATPDSATYSAFLEAGLLDAWTQSHPGDAGYTWGPTAETTRIFNQRIDYVFASGGIQGDSASLVGSDPTLETGTGRYPSDHLGLLATFDLRATAASVPQGIADPPTADMLLLPAAVSSPSKGQTMSVPSSTSIPSIGSPLSAADQVHANFTLLPSDVRNAYHSELSSAAAMWQSADALALQRFDALLSMEDGAMGISKVTMMRDLLFTTMPLSNR
jgi:endonuclease/exonuclease/phosphatase family metal-dependent hydrolase